MADGKVVEGDFQNLLTGCSSHHAYFDWRLRRKFVRQTGGDLCVTDLSYRVVTQVVTDG